jgi:hypothetical protein
MKQFRLEFDRDYGIDRLTGWSVTVNGVVRVQFAPGPIRALWRAIWYRGNSWYRPPHELKATR